MLQVESYNMYAILQIFKRSISLDTPFFESITKKPLVSMDDMFQWVDKYAMLEDDIEWHPNKFWSHLNWWKKIKWGAWSWWEVEQDRTGDRLNRNNEEKEPP